MIGDMSVDTTIEEWRRGRSDAAGIVLELMLRGIEAEQLLVADVIAHQCPATTIGDHVAVDLEGNTSTGTIDINGVDAVR